MKFAILMAGLVAGAALTAAPTATVTSVAQDAETRVVTVSYELTDGPSVVTADVLTNGVSIGLEHVRTLWGDVNRRMTNGTHAFSWHVDRDWPGQNLAAAFQVRLTAWPQNDGPDYMLVNLQVTNDVAYYCVPEQLPYGAITNRPYKTEKMLFRCVRPRGETFRMGSVPGEYGRSSASAAITQATTVGSDSSGYGPGGVIGRETLHEVTLTKNYYLAVYELTQRQYERLLTQYYGALQSWGQTGCLPVQRPSWWGPQYYGQLQNYPLRPLENVSHALLTTAANATPETSAVACLRNLSGLTVVLPTEAQWEYAARAGSTAALYSNREILATNGVCANVSALARYRRNGGLNGGKSEHARYIGRSTDDATAPVGTYAPNAWGFYDMYGNVWELCRDTFVEDLGAAAATDPCATGGDKAAVRGGSYIEEAACCRSASRAGIGLATAYRGVGVRLCVEL